MEPADLDSALDPMAPADSLDGEGIVEGEPATFPVDDDDARPLPDGPAPLVLLIEDNRTNRMLTSVVLKRSGFVYETAGSAEEAREMLADTSPDLILMDLQLPGIDGLAFTRELRRQAKYVRIPIVALTARAMRGDELMTIEAGCDGYVPKPIDVRTFPEFLREILARNKSTQRTGGSNPPAPPAETASA